MFTIFTIRKRPSTAHDVTYRKTKLFMLLCISHDGGKTREHACLTLFG